MSADDWIPAAGNGDRPRYIEISEAIRADIESGRLQVGDRLPPQRRIAKRLDTDVSTIARGYAEAVRRGYVDAHVGRGTFVRDLNAPKQESDPQRSSEEDRRMNMPPEPDDPRLIEKMRSGLKHLSANIVPLLRYQSSAGSHKDIDAALRWMDANAMRCNAENLIITPGAHAAIFTALSVLRQPNSTVLCESVTYPGIRAIAGQLDLPLIGLQEDQDGILPDALDAAIQAQDHAILYLNPTLRNPTTQTMPEQRRADIARVLAKHGTPIVEDDAYCFVSTDPPDSISSLIPDLGFHIAGISKVFGAGLRLAYTHIPGTSSRSAFLNAMRAAHVMTSPISLALLSTWIEDGTAVELQSFVRSSAAERQGIARDVLKGLSFAGDPGAFNVWLTLPDGLNRAEVMASQAKRRIGIMPSDVFNPNGPGQEKLRVCLGGPISTKDLRRELADLRESLMHSDWAG